MHNNNLCIGYEWSKLCTTQKIDSQDQYFAVKSNILKIGEMYRLNYYLSACSTGGRDTRPITLPRTSWHYDFLVRFLFKSIKFKQAMRWAIFLDFSYMAS